jgi:hypothetical protein
MNGRNVSYKAHGKMYVKVNFKIRVKHDVASVPNMDKGEINPRKFLLFREGTSLNVPGSY